MTLLQSIVPGLARSPMGASDTEARVKPAYTVREDDHGYNVTVHLPGVAKDGLYTRKRDARRVVLTELHLDFADGGAERGVLRLCVVRGEGERQRFIEAMLREEARLQHLRCLSIALRAISHRAPRDLLGEQYVAWIARLA